MRTPAPLSAAKHHEPLSIASERCANRPAAVGALYVHPAPCQSDRNLLVVKDSVSWVSLYDVGVRDIRESLSRLSYAL